MERVVVCAEISLSGARLLVGAAEARAVALGLAIATMVVDRGGVPRLFARMDGAPLIAVDAARRKAITAVGMGLATGQAWLDFMGDDPVLREGVGNLADFILLGGGAPLRVQGELVGAIGVSGGHYTQDEACVAAALAAFEVA